MKCPVCDIDLMMTERQGIEIDFCTKCRGVWLDRGELDKIIERSALEMPQRQSGENENRHYDKHHEEDRGNGYYKKKRSFLFDLFD